MKTHVGTCGWSYLNPDEFGIKDWRKRYKHKLQAYAKLFDLVEVNSSFYRIPRLSTAKTWRRLADEVNKDFEFTVKASRIITHQDAFSSETSVRIFKMMKDVCLLLRADKLLLQCPTSFENKPENYEKMRKFFGEIDREIHGYELHLIWEPRGSSWWNRPEDIKALCKEFELIHCVDPFKTEPQITGNIVYLRMHGVPPGTEMYRYDYTNEDLQELLRKIRSWRKTCYVLFNNDTMYKNGKEFANLIK